MPAETPAAAPPVPQLRVGSQAWTLSQLILRPDPAIPKGRVSVEAKAKVRLEEARADMPGWWNVTVLSGKSKGATGWAPASLLNLEGAPSEAARRAALLRQQQSMAETVAVELAPQRAAELAEVNLLLKSTDASSRIAGYKRLQFSGIEDEALYDEIARRLLDGIGEGKVLVERSWGRALAVGLAAPLGGALGGAIAGGIYQANHPGQEQLEKENRRERAEQISELSWMASALSYSGNPKYRPVLEHVASPEAEGGRRIAGQAQKALDALDQYALYNAIINSGVGYVAGQPWRFTRIRTMLQSGEHDLIRDAVNRVVAENPPQPVFFDAVAEQLLKSYQDDLTDELKEDSVAMLVKALGRSRDPKYLATLKTVGDGVKSGKVRNYVESSTKALSPSAD